MSNCRKASKKELLSIINHEDEEYFRWRDDMKCVSENPQILLQRAVEEKEKNIRKMKQHLRKHLGPAWFQELSETQIAGADSIFDAISYDSEDFQYSRTRKALLNIGLNPLPKKCETLKAIQFSRGNDLALLWQLFETVFNNCNDITEKNSFTMNERLLLSCICHLDMMTTLRELDKILPKPEPKRQKLRTRTKKIKLKSIEYATPYDEPIPKPKLQQKKFFTKPQSLHPKFELYKKYKDSSHVIRNEANRWFDEENPLSSESRNIAKAIVCSQIKNVDNENHANMFSALCEKHHQESSKFVQLMKKVLDGKMAEKVDEELQDYDLVERGIVYGVQLELAEAEKKEQNLNEELEKQSVVKSQLLQIIADAVKLRCKKCDDCVKVSKNKIQEKASTINAEPPQNDDVHQKYFHRSTKTSQFMFDYEKIFATSFLNDCGVIKNSINTALEVDKHLTEDNAITVCLKDMWQQEMKKWDEKRQSEMEKKSQHVVVDCEKIGNDKRKIFRLLYQGIRLMRKNPKFILASLPGVERLPLLREWVLHRYGISYTSKDNEARWKVNKLYREHLDLSGVLPKIEIPTAKMFGVKKTLMTYDEALNKTLQRDDWVNKYHKKIANGIINRNRLYWSTMEPFLCDTERMRQIFYAYLPARECDVDKIVMNESII